MNINFNSIYIQDFLAISQCSIDLRDRGILVILGKNLIDTKSESNGSGKSTVIDAIVWCLTDKTVRGVSKDAVVNKYVDHPSTLVTLDFDVDEINYVVTRTRCHPDYGNNLLIYKDGEDISGTTFQKSEEVLRGEIDLPFDVITSIMVLGADMSGKFTSLTPSGRKQRLEQLAGTTVLVDDARELVSDYSKMVTEMYDRSKSSRDKLEGQIDLARQKLEELVEKKESATEVSKLQIDELLSRIDSLTELQNNLLITMNSNRSHSNALLTKIREYEVTRAGLSSKLSLSKGQLGLVSQGLCPTCKRPLDNDSLIDKEQLSRTISELSSRILKIDSDLVILNTKYQTVQNLLEKSEQEYKDAVKSIMGLNTEYQAVKSLYDLRDMIDDQITSFTEKLASDDMEYSQYNSTLSQLTSRLEICGYINQLITKEFRSYVLESVVDYMNSRLLNYSKVLFDSRQVNIKIDGNNLNVLLDDMYYENLSSGERRRVDLLTQITLRDIAQTQTRLYLNLLVLDEVLDKLDKTGINCVLELIGSQSGTVDTIIVASHKDDINLTADSTLLVTKGTNRVSTVSEVL